MLGAQNDDFLKGLDAAQLEGVAQSLIEYSGAEDPSKALEFFMNNRDMLGVVAAPKAPATTTADAQTAAAMTAGAAPAPQPEERGFFEKLFKVNVLKKLSNLISVVVLRERINIIRTGNNIKIDKTVLIV